MSIEVAGFLLVFLGVPCALWFFRTRPDVWLGWISRDSRRG